MGAFGRVFEVNFPDFSGYGILHGQGAVGQVARQDAFAIGEVPVEKALAAGDDRFFVLFRQAPRQVCAPPS